MRRWGQGGSTQRSIRRIWMLQQMMLPRCLPHWTHRTPPRRKAKLPTAGRKQRSATHAVVQTDSTSMAEIHAPEIPVDRAETASSYVALQTSWSASALARTAGAKTQLLGTPAGAMLPSSSKVFPHERAMRAAFATTGFWCVRRPISSHVREVARRAWMVGKAGSNATTAVGSVPCPSRAEPLRRATRAAHAPMGCWFAPRKRSSSVRARLRLRRATMQRRPIDVEDLGRRRSPAVSPHRGTSVIPAGTCFAVRRMISSATRRRAIPGHAIPMVDPHHAARFRRRLLRRRAQRSQRSPRRQRLR
jgi:hypothetical protein